MNETMVREHVKARITEVRKDLEWADKVDDMKFGFDNNKLIGPEWMSMGQLTEFFACTRPTIYSWQKEMEFPKNVKLEGFKPTYTNRRAVEIWINNILADKPTVPAQTITNMLNIVSNTTDSRYLHGFEGEAGFANNMNDPHYYDEQGRHWGIFTPWLDKR